MALEDAEASLKEDKKYHRVSTFIITHAPVIFTIINAYIHDPPIGSVSEG